MSAMAHLKGVLRVAVVCGVLLSLSACVSYYQPRYGEDGFYHEGRHGPEVIVVETTSFSRFDPAWYPWWSLQWSDVDRHRIAAPPPPAFEQARRDQLTLDARRVERRVIRHEAPQPSQRTVRATGGVPSRSTTTRATSTIHTRSVQREAVRPNPPRQQEP
jgi:hypothetical protein